MLQRLAHALTSQQAGVLSFHEGLRHEIALLYRRPGVLTTCVCSQA